MNKLSQLNVPLIHKIFASQIDTNEENDDLYFHRQPSTVGIGEQVMVAKVSLKNTTVAFQRLAKLHSYDPDGMYHTDGLPILYVKSGDLNAM
jgi:hypothetical protein